MDRSNHLSAEWARALRQLPKFPWETSGDTAIDKLRQFMGVALWQLVPEPTAAAVLPQDEDPPVIGAVAGAALYLASCESYADGQAPRIRVARESLDPQRVTIDASGFIQTRMGEELAGRITWTVGLPTRSLIIRTEINDESEIVDPQQELVCQIAKQLGWNVPMFGSTAALRTL